MEDAPKLRCNNLTNVSLRDSGSLGSHGKQSSLVCKNWREYVDKLLEKISSGKGSLILLLSNNLANIYNIINHNIYL